jgi:hypothetical protein
MEFFYRHHQRNTSYILYFIGRYYLLRDVSVWFLNHLLVIYIYEYCYTYNWSVVLGVNCLSVLTISICIYFVYVMFCNVKYCTQHFSPVDFNVNDFSSRATNSDPRSCEYNWMSNGAECRSDVASTCGAPAKQLQNNFHSCAYVWRQSSVTFRQCT